MSRWPDSVLSNRKYLCKFVRDSGQGPHRTIMLTKSIRKIFGIGLARSKKLTEGENKFVIDGRQLTELRGELSDTGYYLEILDRRPKIG